MDLSNAYPFKRSESARLEALGSFGILDTPSEREFDDLTRLAAVALGVESAAISLIDEKRQWFKARHGIPFAETPRDVAFCTHAVASEKLLVVPDASKDPRFSGNPLVTQERGIRFYAGMPLIVYSGYCLGTLCVFDPEPRDNLTSVQLKIFNDLAQLAVDLIESRRLRRMSVIAAKVVETTSDAVLAADQAGAIVYWNAAAEQMFGRSASEVVGRDIEIILPQRHAAALRKLFARAAAGEMDQLLGSFVELSATRADGSDFPAEFYLARWGDAAPDAALAAIVRNISVRKGLERERQQAQTFLDTVVSNLPAMLFVKDAGTREYLMINRAGEGVMGKPAEEILGSTDRQLFPGQGAAYEQRDAEAASSTEPTVFESVFKREDGRSVHVRTIRKLIDGPERPNQYILGITEDVTNIRTAEAEVQRLAHFDSLTGLLNRASYADRLHRLVHAAVPFAMLSIDLDRFKAVNDQFGHPVGDDVLAQVGERLRACLGPADWVARIGGDEFVAVLLGENLRQRAGTVGEAIVTSLRKPLVTDRAVCHAGASVGIVLFPEDGTTTEQIRENVDLALYRAKQDGRGVVCLFNAEMDAAARDRRKLEVDLRKAVEADQIELYYQPLLEVASGRISSAEALARWTHPSRGPIRPDVFISLAEECGLIDTLGEQLLRRACTDASMWPADVRVAVNLSPLQFVSGELVNMVRAILSETGFHPARLQLEVTEGLVIRDVERTFLQLEELRTLGIQILIDDFGVGYSSLSYFQRFPFDKVKIDKSFVDDITEAPAAKAIVEAVVGLGNSLGMGIVAEGIETEAQMRMLVVCGCTHLQGYMFSRPVPNQTLMAFLKAGLWAGNLPDAAAA